MCNYFTITLAYSATSIPPTLFDPISWQCSSSRTSMLAIMCGANTGINSWDLIKLYLYISLTRRGIRPLSKLSSSSKLPPRNVCDLSLGSVSFWAHFRPHFKSWFPKTAKKFRCNGFVQNKIDGADSIWGFRFSSHVTPLSVTNSKSQLKTRQSNLFFPLSDNIDHMCVWRIGINRKRG